MEQILRSDERTAFLNQCLKRIIYENTGEIVEPNMK